MRKSVGLALALCAAVVSACSFPPPEPPSPRSPPPAGDDEFVAATEAAIIADVNKRRRAAGVTALTVDSRLARAARLHAVNMAARGELSHTLSGVTPSTLVSRVTDAGYPFAAVAENIAYGPEAVEDLVDGWMQSSGHRQNILHPAYTDTGVGIARSRGGVRFYCQVFGRPRSGL